MQAGFSVYVPTSIKLFVAAFAVGVDQAGIDLRRGARGRVREFPIRLLEDLRRAIGREFRMEVMAAIGVVDRANFRSLHRSERRDMDAIIGWRVVRRRGRRIFGHRRNVGVEPAATGDGQREQGQH